MRCTVKWFDAKKAMGLFLQKVVRKIILSTKVTLLWKVLDICVKVILWILMSLPAKMVETLQ